MVVMDAGRITHHPRKENAMTWADDRALERKERDDLRLENRVLRSALREIAEGCEEDANQGRSYTRVMVRAIANTAKRALAAKPDEEAEALLARAAAWMDWNQCHDDDEPEPEDGWGLRDALRARLS